MTNDQIPMTNEKDNDQFTNNQLNKQKGKTACLTFGYWLLLVFLVIGIWSLVILFSSDYRFLTNAVTAKVAQARKTTGTQMTKRPVETR